MLGMLGMLGMLRMPGMLEFPNVDGDAPVTRRSERDAQDARDARDAHTHTERHLGYVRYTPASSTASVATTSLRNC